ncbi:mediator of RNA polymerase II transcription subunit 10 [Naviculisporaceae sp. PSN 640]
MAPVNPQLNNVQEQVKNVLQDIFQIMTQVSHYDASGRPSRDPLVNDIQNLTESLKKVYTEAELLPPPPDPAVSSTITPHTAPSGYIGIPLPLIQYVEDGRNPDIYTREFVELVRRMNQLAKGKVYAFRNFRDVLAHEMNSALPELRDDVQRVLESTGGLHTAEFTYRPAAGGQGQGQGQMGGASAGDGSNSHALGPGGSMNMSGN